MVIRASALLTKPESNYQVLSCPLTPLTPHTSQLYTLSSAGLWCKHQSDDVSTVLPAVNTDRAQAPDLPPPTHKLNCRKEHFVVIEFILWSLQLFHILAAFLSEKNYFFKPRGRAECLADPVIIFFTPVTPNPFNLNIVWSFSFYSPQFSIKSFQAVLYKITNNVFSILNVIHPSRAFNVMKYINIPISRCSPPLEAGQCSHNKKIQ